MKHHSQIVFRKFFLVLIICIFSVAAKAQEDQYKKAMSLKAEFKYKDALPLFQELLKSDSSNIDYLQYSSQVYTRYGYLYMPTTKEKQNYFHIGEYLARKALAKDDNSAQAHFALCLALGRINENAGNKQKIANAKLIKTEIDKTILLDPKIANAYHILGRWNTTIASFSSGEKRAINLLYGGVPSGASFEEGIKAYQTAIALDPKNMLHYYEIAQTYLKMKNKAESKTWLAKAMALPVVSDDDKLIIEQCKTLKAKLD